MMRLGQEDDPWLQMGLSRSARREEVNRTYRYAATRVADPDPYGSIFIQVAISSSDPDVQIPLIYFENYYIGIFIKIIF
jgi:hypothetical protein